MHPNDTIPPRLCECGCGNPTPPAKRTNRTKGRIEGQPLRFIPKHQKPKYPNNYIVDPETGCWVWQGAKLPGGYGTMSRSGEQIYTHRYYYERAKGPIPAGLQLDHLCRNRACCNPDHLEPVTHAVNLQRGATAKLTPDDVREIRRIFSEGGVTVTTLSRTYGVAFKTINRIVRNLGWHLD